jgi:hypothetical protein
MPPPITSIEDALLCPKCPTCPQCPFLTCDAMMCAVYAGRFYVLGEACTCICNNAAKEPWTQASRQGNSWLKPSALHRIPTPLQRCWISHWHALSPIPLPRGKPRAWSAASSLCARCRSRDADPVRRVSRAVAGKPSTATASARAASPPAGWPCRRRCRAQPHPRRACVGRPSRQAAARFHRCGAAWYKSTSPRASPVQRSANSRHRPRAPALRQTTWDACLRP